MPMPLYRVVAAYRTDAQEILLVLEHGETIYRVEGDADIVCADLEEARLAHGQGTPRLAPALLLAWREGSALGAFGSLPPRPPSPAPTGCRGRSPPSGGTGRASQQPGGPVLVGGTAGEPCGEPWTVGRLAALTVPNHATEA